MPKSYNYILLDWDGNLAKTLDIWLVAIRTVMNNRGLYPTDQEVASCFGASEERFKEFGLEDVDAALDEADLIAKQGLPDVELYPNALGLLHYLRKTGKKVALLTSSPHENIKHLLEKYEMQSFFDAIVAADDVKHHKPHPEPIEKALQLLGGNKRESVIIGDSDKDLGAAKNAGVDSILFYPPEHAKFYDVEVLKEHGPTYVIQDFREAEAIIK